MRKRKEFEISSDDLESTVNNVIKVLFHRGIVKRTENGEVDVPQNLHTIIDNIVDSMEGETAFMNDDVLNNIK